MLPDMGNTIYEIRTGDQTWVGVGKDIERKSRMGFTTTEQMSVIVYVQTAGKPEIPKAGLSLYENGKTRHGEEGAWQVVSTHSVGEETSAVKMTT